MTVQLSLNASPMLDGSNEKSRGAGVITVNLDWSVPQTYSIGINQATLLNTFGTIKSMWYNNMNNPSDITMTIEGTQMLLILPKNSQGMLPIVANSSSRFNLVSAGGNATPVQIQFYNFVNAGFGIPNWAAAAFTINTTATGKDANGTPPTGFPVLVAGWDGVNVRTLKTDAGGNLQTTITPPSLGATQANVAVNVAVVTLQAANAARRGWSVLNDSTIATLSLRLGAGATLTNGTVKLLPGAYWEMPYNYVGQITGIWDVADAAGAARVTEYA